MTSITNSIAAKLTVAFVAVALMFSVVAPAKAQTIEELQELIAGLMAQINALQAQAGISGGVSAPGVCPYTWTRTFGQGATGADVMQLQKFLNADPETRLAVSGAGSPGMETQYYGPVTAAAVSKFQVKYRADVLTPGGLVNPTGYFGPASMSKANALCVSGTTTPGGDSGSGSGQDSLSGGEASLDNFSLRTGEFVDVEEGTSDVPVAEMIFDVKDGDISVNRVDLTFNKTGVDGDSDPWRVFRDVSLWVDGERVATQRADNRDNWSRNTPSTGDYRLRFSGLSEIFREDDQAEIVVAVSALGTVRGSDGDGDVAWSVQVLNDGLRARDGAGLDQFAGKDGEDVEFNVVREGRDDELRVRVSSLDPSAGIIELEDDRTSNFIRTFAFELDTRDSTSDIQINDLIVKSTVDAATGTAILSDIATDMRLVIDGRNYSRKDYFASSTAATGTAETKFTFNDGELVIDRGDRVQVSVEVRYKALPSSLEGTTIQLATGMINAEGAQTFTATGSVVGEEHTLLTEGLNFSKNSLTANLIQATVEGQNDRAEYTLVVDVTAVGETFYVDDNAATAYAYTIFKDGVSDKDQPIAATSTPTINSNAPKSGNRFRIDEGSTRTFTFKVNVQPGGDAGAYRVQFDTVTFFDMSTGGATSTQTLIPTQDFRSNEIVIVN